jgi:hypothetical protein
LDTGKNLYLPANLNVFLFDLNSKYARHVPLTDSDLQKLGSSQIPQNSEKVLTDQRFCLTSRVSEKQSLTSHQWRLPCDVGCG